MQQHHLERFLRDFAEYDLKHLEMFGFGLLEEDDCTYAWKRGNLSLTVSVDPRDGYLYFNFVQLEDGFTNFASLDVIYHTLGGRGKLLSNQYSRPKSTLDLELKRFQWLVMLERIEPILLNPQALEKIFQDHPNSLLIWPPPKFGSEDD